jgi:hypothetical protein
MKLTVELGDELQPAIEEHLRTGAPVQAYFLAALKFFNEAIDCETNGRKVSWYPLVPPGACLQSEVDALKPQDSAAEPLPAPAEPGTFTPGSPSEDLSDIPF